MTNNEYLEFLNTINELPKKQYEIIRRGVLQLNEEKKELLSIIKYLQNNRDKAIEYIEEKGRLKYSPNELIDILKGGSDE